MDKDIFRLLIIIFIVLIFLLIFGIRYLKSKETMAMIERGMMPLEDKKNTGNRLILYACLLFGFGFGLLTSYIVMNHLMSESPGFAVMIIIPLFMGIALLVANRLQSKKE
ncbi:DUF6249 domain-containing protein [Sediminibacterium sp.]|jgi:uncharacterized membrane protein|uniref:DUF6249 domain-containing protein n=1 Tax=Sediminibacterium sp. TaxID=1917865 RepID=UPI0025E7DF6E|nr:DUF6249 domain-containing protein [Sediminibacterium sp.]MBT9485120.1 hypothetical protein [Sediminibacterium sp.]